METTFEEAAKCPKCREPGVALSVRSAPRGSKVHPFKCANERCQYFETGWIVQVMADGTIPKRQPGPKEFAPQSKLMEQFARDNLRQAIQEDPGLAEHLKHHGL